MNRLEQRKARTRAALVSAAQAFIAGGKLNVPILEITQAADVGMGSFYNHFQTKDELFQAAVENAVDAGRFTVRDPELTMVIIAGAALALGQLLHDHPDRDDAAATDQITEDLLRMLGVPADEAHDICQRPLPDIPLRDTQKPLA